MAEGGEIDRSFRLPRALDCSEPVDEVGSKGGEYWLPESTSGLEEDPGELSDAGNDRFFISWGELRGTRSAGFGKAGGDGGLVCRCEEPAFG